MRLNGVRTRTFLIYFLISLVIPAATCPAATLFQQVGIASPPLPVGSGARAMGMGGAFIAVADDATAASWNPAGLIQIEKPELSVVGAFDSRRYDYTSDDQTDFTSRDDYASVNYFSAAMPFHLYKNMVVSVNYQRLYDFQRDLSHDFSFAAAGVDLVQDIRFDQSGYVGAAAIAGAVELTPRLSVGATLNIWTDELGWDNGWTERYHSHATGTQSGVPVTIDTRITDTYSKFSGINFNVGLLWETPAHGTLGAVIKTPFTATLDHRFEMNETTVYGAPVDTTLTSAPVVFEEDVELRMPLSYGLGWSKRFRDVWTLGMDVYRTEWGEYFLRDGRGNKFSPIDGRPKDKSNVHATTHVRIGTEYLFLLPSKNAAVPLRAGLFYDPEPAEGAPLDYYGLALGAGFSRPRYSLDLAYQFRWASDIDTGHQVAATDADAVQHTVLMSFIFYL
ncbi:MAG: hypothetical protein HKM93_18760 [Desulfobacteraceae bacterium]|nr:hypothetical protein [Desulfobacteraceae bacterium]